MINTSYMFVADAHVEPQLMDDIRVGRQKTKALPVLRRITSEYGSMVLGSATGKQPGSDEVLQLRAGLFAATQHLGVHVPAVHALQPARFREDTVCPPVVNTLKDRFLELDADIVPAAEITVESQPTPVAFIPCHNFHSTHDIGYEEEKTSFLRKLDYSETERVDIEMMTRGQNEVMDWYKQRMGSVTSSISYQVKRLMAGARILPERLVDQCMGYKHRHLTKPPRPGRESLKWGCEHENNARQWYTKVMTSPTQHEDFKVNKSGLVVHPTLPYIRASPDGVVTCKCHHPHLIEIKCLYSAKTLTVDDAIKMKKVEYVEKTDDGYKLLEKRGYYDQIQCAMACCELKLCDFVIWTPLDMVVIRVPFDATYWQDLSRSPQQFFEQYIVAEILTGRVRMGLSLTGREAEDGSNSDEACVAAALAAENTDAQINVAEDTGDVAVSLVVRCAGCTIILPEADYVADDNNDASVGCECDVCQCDSWYCWSCASFSEEKAESGIKWTCPKCCICCVK